jgi:MFS family permease
MVFSAVGILATYALTIYSFGIFLRPITEQFNWDRGALSAALSIGMLVSGPLSIFTGRLSDRHGPRLLVTGSGLLTGTAFMLMSQVSALWHVYLLYGVAMALGGSGCIVPVSSTIPRWFHRRRGVAIGLTWTGIGLGGIVTPLLAQGLISGYGWREAYVVLGAANLIIVMLLAQTLRRDPQQMGLRPYGEKETPAGEPATPPSPGLTLKQAIRTGRFWLFGLVMLGFVFTMQVMMAHITPHAIDVGVPAGPAASVVSIWAATSLIGRNLAGFVADRIGAARSVALHLTAMALTIVWLLFAREPWTFYVFAAVYGIAYGGVVPMQTLMAGELFGLRSLGMIVASLMMLGSAGGALGPPLAGAIFDATGEYQIAFLISLGLIILAIILSVILTRSRHSMATYPTGRAAISPG